VSRDATTLDAVRRICDRLSERTATLFLGAGINAGVTSDTGEAFPLGQDLSDWISRDLLGSPGLHIPLDESAEIARYKLGATELNRYIFDTCSRFKPGTAHLALLQLPWDVIFTTNYDLLVEQASTSNQIRPAGSIRQVLSVQTDLTQFSESDILYYKLHGSVDFANTEGGRLIITKEDYRHYLSNRKPLFKRLERDLIGHSLVFIGYSFRDDNFRGLLEDCREELGARAFPLSFAVRPDFSGVEETFWREKYNIQLLDTTSDEFLELIKESWISQSYSVIPFEDRKASSYLQVDRATKFPKIAESFYQIIPAACTGESQPELFFRGAEPTWSDIRAEVAPYRDAYWALYDAIFPELNDPTLPPSVFLVTGAAGNGKTTLIYSLAYSLANEFDLPVFLHISSTPFDSKLIAPIVDDKNLKRIVIFVRHAGEMIRSLERFVVDAKQKRLPVTLILEERKNQWANTHSLTRSKLLPAEFDLGALSPKEIDDILTALAKFNLLGKLTGSSRDYQVQHFTALAHKELLVALRELTTEGTFDNIIKDEFEKVPSEKAQRAYVYVSALGQLDLALRYETLVHLLDLRYDQLQREVFVPTEGVLISGEESGSSRHNAGFRLRARHPIIASIIFAAVAPDDDSKFSVVNDLLTHLDPGFPEDRRLLQEIVRRRELVNTFASDEKRRAIYERLAVILPENPYVFQHRSILEKELENAELAVKFARRAVKMKPDDSMLKNTLGLALEYAARSTRDAVPKEALLSEADRLFSRGIEEDPSNPYEYIGKVNIIKHKLQDEPDPERRAILQANMLSFLQEAYEATDMSPIIAGELATHREALGSQAEAISVLRAGLKKRPGDVRLRDLWIRFELENGNLEQALAIAVDGALLNPTSWRIQRHIARIKRSLGENPEAIKGHYEAAIRHNKGDISLMVELGAYLFTKGMTFEAKQVFAEVQDLSITGHERSQIREMWKDEKGLEVVFSGKVKNLKGAVGFAIAIPENFEAKFWRTSSRLSDLRENEPVKFKVGFSAHGAMAQIQSDSL
jgi:Flp pilus assembly protein TadD